MSQVKNFKYLGLTATICFKQILVHTVRTTYGTGPSIVREQRAQRCPTNRIDADA